MTKREMQKVERRLIGRCVVAIDWQTFDGATEGSSSIKTQQPRVKLDDGSTLRFVVDETEIGEYGVSLLIVDEQP